MWPQKIIVPEDGSLIGELDGVIDGNNKKLALPLEESKLQKKTRERTAEKRAAEILEMAQSGNGEKEAAILIVADALESSVRYRDMILRLQVVIGIYQDKMEWFAGEFPRFRAFVRDEIEGARRVVRELNSRTFPDEPRVN